MDFLGFLLLFGLSALAGLAALAVAVRARLRGRAEVLLAATMLWNGIIILPTYVLGFTNTLSAGTLSVSSVVVSLATLAAASYGVGPRALLRDTWRAFLGQLRLPFEAVMLGVRPPRIVFVAIAFTAVLLPYVAVSAWFGQQVAHWDPLWYHDTMVGFAIQNHGFAVVDLPETLQKVNGYVRLGEMTQLWMVIFSDRRLADVANLLFAPAIIAGTYILARRHTSKVLATAWGVAVVLMPACSQLIHSTFVDTINAAHVLAGVVFATVARPRLREGWLTALALTLAIGSKGLSLISVPAIGLVGAVLLVRAHRGERRRAALATVAVGLVAIVGMASLTYFRNYLVFHNPFWPDMRVDIKALGIHWPGQGPWASDPTDPSKHGVPLNLNEPPHKLLDQLFALPWSVKGMFFDQTVEYGIGMVWVVLPLGAIAFVATFVAAIRRRGRREVGEPGGPPPVAVALIVAVMVGGSPALWAPRYHIALVGLICSLVAWFTSRPRWAQVGESAASVVAIASLMMFWWVPYSRWWTTPEQLAKLARLPAIEREVDFTLRAPTTRVAGLAREKELGPGKLLVFNERYSGFPSLFWNNTYSNRIKFMRGGAGFLVRAAQAGATWVYLAADDPAIGEARTPGSGWEEVGPLNPINLGFGFRRVAPPPPVPAKSPPPAPAKAPAPEPPMLGPPAPAPKPAAPMKRPTARAPRGARLSR